MKDGTSHLAYKPEHAVDLDTGAVVAAEMLILSPTVITKLGFVHDLVHAQRPT
jgi:hypothetical protein